MIIHRVSFLFILLLTWPIRFLSYRAIHQLGKLLGILAYYFLPKFRKRTLSNLALASSLQLSEKDILCLAKASLSNLMITCLEYAKFASETDIHRVATCVNPETANQLMKENKPVIFFCGHQANWEVLFLEGTKRMAGVAIGRPIKNPYLYQWVLSIRQKYGGTMIAPHHAIREGLRGLKKGAFLGIVGDQGMPDSGYCSNFLGRPAWTSPIAAILSYRTGCPIIVATTLRKNGKYYIHYSDPIWPHPDVSLDQEIHRLMSESLGRLEEKIKEEPGQWLWSHNRWKQQTPDRLKKRFRHESILIILSEKNQTLISDLKTFREIYPQEFITVYAPQTQVDKIEIKEAEVIPYLGKYPPLPRDFRFKLVFNLSSLPRIKSHFKKLSAFEVISLKDLYAEAGKDPSTAFSEVLKKAILKDAS